MIWGCMSWDGIGFMCKIDGIMDQHLYMSILKDDLWKTIKDYKWKPERMIFQQDNDPKHKAAAVQKWLSNQPFSIIDDWPGQSPDLNPIEHLWAHLKRQLNRYEKASSGILELWERVQDEWWKIPPKTCQDLIESMPRRCEAVIRAKGRWTKY